MIRRSALAIAFGTVAPALGAGATLDIETATTDVAAISAALGGDRVAVRSLTSGTSDPHFVEARPSMIRRLRDADLVIVIGADLEIGWLPAALQAARNGRIQPGRPGYLDLSDHVPLLEGQAGPVSRAVGDVHGNGNPHYLLDPENGRRAARAIADRLARLDPEAAAGYAARLAAFERALDEKLAEWRARLAPLRGASAVSYHKSLPYLAAAFGFTIAGQIEPLPGIAPTAAHLAALVERIRRERIALLLIEPFYERRSARYLEEQTGIRTVVLPTAVGAEPEIRTYLDLFDAIAARLSGTGTR
jgi:zinc/manganese transport system substrate-binding protein